jgi:predicted aldo/keto reductase-like oxidoreductase
MDEDHEKILGRTNLAVGRLGVSASYGAPAEAFEEAFERGCNYFYWGSGRKKAGMSRAIRNIGKNGKRDKLVIALQTYARNGLLAESVFTKRLQKLGLTYADVLILGWHNREPSQKLLDRVVKMKEKGLFRFLAMSGHHRPIFQKMAETGIFDIFHIRYNAAHRGAEEDCFPFLTGENRPGIVTYTATRHGYLLNSKHMPPGESPLSSTDCYRFAMSHPAVDVCLCGPKDLHQMQDALNALELGPLDDEMRDRAKKIGDHVHKTAKGYF